VDSDPFGFLYVEDYDVVLLLGDFSDAAEQEDCA